MLARLLEIVLIELLREPPTARDDEQYDPAPPEREAPYTPRESRPAVHLWQVSFTMEGTTRQADCGSFAHR